MSGNMLPFAMRAQRNTSRIPIMPIVIGGEVGGQCSFGRQQGWYTVTHNLVEFSVDVGWKRHTGKGQLVILVPNLPKPKEDGVMVYTKTKMDKTGDMITTIGTHQGKTALFIKIINRRDLKAFKPFLIGPVGKIVFQGFYNT